MASGCGQVVSIWGCAVPETVQMYLSVPFSAYLLYFKRRFNYRLMKHLANTAEEVAKMEGEGRSEINASLGTREEDTFSKR